MTPTRPSLRREPQAIALMRLRLLSLAALLVLSPLALAQEKSSAARPSFAEVADKLKDSVVTISTAAAPQEAPTVAGKPNKKGEDGQPFHEFFEEFFGRSPDGLPQHITSVGSGFVIDAEGYIVTNNHVVEGGGEIYVDFHDGTRLKVEKVVGRDVKTDITVLKVSPKEGEPLSAVTFGDSGAMRVGDWVMAVGNPFGLGGTVTVGILSATGRDINSGPYDEYLQTDAAINRGNSGGPLFNGLGEVIGINTAIISPTGGSIGLGFAVPSNVAKRVVDHLRLYGETRRGWIGVRVQSINEDLAGSLGLDRPRGALIADVSEDGPAKAAGLAEGDVILAYAGTEVRSSRQLPRLVAQSSVDEDVDVEVLRGGARKTLKVKVGLLDETAAAVTAKAPKPETSPDLPQKKPMNGLTVLPLTDALRAAYSLAPGLEGVVVTAVETGGAAGSGLAPGDVILEAAHQKVRTLEEFEARLASLKLLERRTALLTIAKRDGAVTFVDVDLD